MVDAFYGETQRILREENLVCTLGYLTTAYQLRNWLGCSFELLDDCKLRTGSDVEVNGRSQLRYYLSIYSSTALWILTAFSVS
jgi:hypothetical protein